MDKNYLVAYFSATGTTKEVAKTIAKTVNADLYEIKAKIPYFQNDLNWNDKKSRSYQEWRNKNIRPEISCSTLDISKYDVVFVGYPIWWESAPNIILTFLENYNFDDKIIIPFSTSGGSIRGSRGLHLYRYCSKQANWKLGKLLNNATENEVRRWIRKLDI